MPKKLTTITGLIIVAVIVLAANLIASVLFDRAKIDVTEEKLYSLSQGSINISKSLEDQITAQLYFSKSVASENPQFQAYADRVIQMLREYEALSGGKFVLQIIDPRPDTEEEEWAERYGLQGVPVGPATRMFLGLVLKDESDNERVIPFFSPQRESSLEYDITKAIYGLDYATKHPNKQKPTVGLISSLDLTGGGDNPMMRNPRAQEWLFLRELRGEFSVKQVETDAEELPTDLDLLLIVHPKSLSEPLQYAIDQYVLGGGKVLAFVDPLSFVDQRDAPQLDMQQRMMQSFSSDMPRLFKSWGVELENDGAMPGMMGMPGGGKKMKIVIDPNLSTTIPTQQGYQKHPALLTLTDKQTAKDEIITAQLDQLMMAFAGSLKQTSASDDIRFTPLLTTTDEAGTVGDMIFRFSMPSPDQLLKDLKPIGTDLVLAAKITGKFKTAFEQGRPVKPKEGEEEKGLSYQPDEKQLKESSDTGTIIVVSDVDMLANDLSVQVSNILGRQIYNYANDNIHFIANAVENLTGSKDLIALRSRGRSQRPFTLVDQIERDAQEKWQARQQSLEDKIQQATQRLNDLKRAGGGDNQRILDKAYSDEVRKLREERLSMRRELREIRRHLREDVESLGRWIKFINIALIPLLVVLVSIAIAIIKNMRRKNSV